MDMKGPDDTLRMRRIILISALLRMFEGTFSHDETHLVLSCRFIGFSSVTKEGSGADSEGV